MADDGPRPEIASTITTGEFTTNYHDYGAGDPVVLMHGSGPGVSAFANWFKAFPILSPHFRVLAPDMAGFGYTERVPGAKYNLDTWVRQLIDFLDALGIEKAHLVGNSFGGALALAMAVRYPERVGKLVLMGSMGVSFPITDGLDHVWGYTPSQAHMNELCGIFIFDHAYAPPEVTRSRYESSIQPGFQESYASMFPAPRQPHIDDLAAHEKDLPGILNKTLIIHGLQDNVIPLENSLKLLHLLPDAQLHVFGRCGHWTQIEHTEEFCELLLDFLK